MANGDDGLSEVGGGGSVVWRVKVHNGRSPVTKRVTGTYKDPAIPIPWGYEVQDTDDVLRAKPTDNDDDLYDKFFHIEILEPPPNSPIVYAYDPGGKKLHIFLRIEKRSQDDEQKQIRVMWAATQANVQKLVEKLKLTLFDMRTHGGNAAV